MDIDMKTSIGKFKYRVAGILFNKNNKILIQKIANNKFYCLPGGHVELGETSIEAAERELEEELKFNITIEEPLFLIENIFKNNSGLIIHEVGMYYKLSSNFCPTNDWNYLENDKGILKTLHYKWVTLEELQSIDFRPKLIKEKLNSLTKTFEHHILKNDKIIK